MMSCGKKDSLKIATPQPTIISFSAPVVGVGYPLTIAGTNFDATISNNKVTINGVVAIVTAATTTHLTVIVPDDATSGTITVTISGQSVTSSGSVKIVKLTVTTLAGSGTGGSADGLGTAASFNAFWSVVTDNNGNIFVADADNNKIREITPAGSVSTYAGTGVFTGQVNGAANMATFGSPFGITIDKDQNIFVADLGYNDVRKITPAGIVSTLAGSPYGQPGSNDGNGAAASFNAPLGIVADESDNIYVVDAGNNTIRKITPDGTVTTFAGSGTVGSADGTGTAASFNSPYSITIDANNNLFVTDALNNKIRKITSAGVVSTIAGSGTAGNIDGQGTAASFNEPADVAVDAAGNLYVTDARNQAIRLITPDGFVATVAGNGSKGSVDGTGNSAGFSNPLGITIDKNGVMYVLDNDGGRVRKITIQ